MAFNYPIHGSGKDVSITRVDDRTRNEIINMIESTWNPDHVGIGKDARDLQHTDVNFISIEKIHNARLLATYTEFREHLQRKKQTSGHRYGIIAGIPKKLEEFNMHERIPEINELYLFHGTDAVMDIARKGFDSDEANPNSLYGKGIYFAEKFTKVDQYADDKQDREQPGTELTVLLCRVLLGNFLKCAKDDAKKWKRAPCIKCVLLKPQSCSCGPQDRYDSVLGSGPDMLYREFVVYNGAQCYPEFIIKYQRTGGERTRGKRI